jgi:hypothetical protein
MRLRNETKKKDLRAAVPVELMRLFGPVGCVLHACPRDRKALINHSPNILSYTLNLPPLDPF